MINYTSLPIEYDSGILKECFKGKHGTTNVCSLEEISIIENHLRLTNKVRSVLLFRVRPRSSGYIHKDYISKYPHLRPVWSLLLPIHETAFSTMKWFNAIGSCDINVQASESDRSGMIERLSPTCAEMVGSVVCKEPTIVKINDWHSINNSQDITSMVVSIRLFGNDNRDFSQLK
jgi:hypothetical protein